MSWRDIPGWSVDIVPFYEEMAKVIPQGGVFVEVGVFLGRSLACMGTLRPDLELWAVDPWSDALATGYLGPGEHGDTVRAHGSLFGGFVTMLRMHAPDVFSRVHIVRAKSCDVTLHTLADLIFIDGAHDYLNVRADISHYLDILKPGGIIAGHDYAWDVKIAVDEAFGGAHQMGPAVGDLQTVWWCKR